MERMTSADQAKVVELIKKITRVTQDEDQRYAMHALVFCLFGAVKTSYGLSSREAVEFCAKHIKTYGQFVFS